MSSSLTYGGVLHRLLIESQSTEELQRKADKARTKHYVTQEDIDHANREGKELYESITWC